MQLTPELRRRPRANRNDDRFYAHALTRALPAEVLADALADVTGVPERYTGLHAGTRAVGLVGPQVASESLDVLGRCLRQGSCEAPTAAVAGGGLAAALHRLNGPLLNCRLTAPEGRLQTLLGAGRPETEVLYEFYLRALGRPAAPPNAPSGNASLPPPHHLRSGPGSSKTRSGAC